MAAFHIAHPEVARWRSALGELLLALWSAGALAFAWLILSLCLIGAAPSTGTAAGAPASEQTALLSAER